MTGNTRGTAAPQHTSATRSVGPFEFERGGSVPDLELAYETYGEYDPEGGPNGRGNAVLVCHALTGSQHVASGPDDDGTNDGAAGQARAWWDDVVGPGQAIDTTAYFVVCVNVPGSCYGSTGPASPHPDGGVWGSSFPAVTVGDWTRAQRRLLDEFDVDRLHAVVGGSVGGMNVLDWVRRYPAAVDRAIPIATAPRLDAQLCGLNAVARRAIQGDPEWHGGEYAAAGTHPDRGLALARQLGHLSYLSKASMERKFDRGGSDYDVASPFPDGPAADAFAYDEVESYLDHQGSTFVDRFDANSYLYLTRAMEAFDLAADEDSDADAVAEFDGEALVVSFTGDWHFPVEGGTAIAEAFEQTGTAVDHHVVDSDHGHDAFLVEPENVGPPIREFLGGGVDERQPASSRSRSETADGDAVAGEAGDGDPDNDGRGSDDGVQRPPGTPGTACSVFMS
ncbi:MULTISPECIES: homoserine O-acetyltransferase MetX [Halolamina]|uniref:Homoserine O-acetyltransferase n=1 Tax=Halolamina pelagica TaxID=699431 RepID=A0A1I5MVE7_9EURY|nr:MULTISPECIES: homoserine O-acetyltransferase [Halolamina]NHX36174.1 homoserine O-acetyltransferase [Halolamina sp. R1-12]SFP13440.1 homoserine O-acetyltransferase [Halolamina pelagica]